MGDADRLPRVLYITHRVPHPPDKGDRIRNFNILRELSRVSRVWLACLADEPVPPDSREILLSICERVGIIRVSSRFRWVRAGLSLLAGRSITEGAFHEPVMDQLLAQWLSKSSFHAAVVSSSSLAPYIRRNGWENVPGFVDLIDVDSQKWHDYADASAIPKRWLYRLEAGRVRRLERSIVEWARAVCLVSPAECSVYDAFTHPGASLSAPCGVDLEYFQPGPGSGSSACVFVGAMDYRPNVDGAVWFAREIFPQVRARHPQAEFWIVGRKPAAAVRGLSSIPGVTVTGSVPDVRPYLRDAALAVSPVRIARGLQNKVIEAMAMGKATVSSRVATAALSISPGENLLVADSIEDWVNHVAGLLASPDRCRALGQAARKFVEDHHRWDLCLQPLLERVRNARREPTLTPA